MSTHRRKSPLRLAAHTAELAIAAPQVVAHRMVRIASAGTPLTAVDRDEFLRMGTEKLDAFQQSWAAMWTHAWIAQIRLAHELSAATLATFVGTGRGLSAPLLQLPYVSAQILAAGLAPVHATAVANARRLARPPTRTHRGAARQRRRKERLR